MSNISKKKALQAILDQERPKWIEKSAVDLRQFAVASGVTDPDAEAWEVKIYRVQRFGREYTVEVEVMMRFDDLYQVGLTVYDGTYEMVWLILRQPRCRSVYWEVYDDGKVRML